jgi:hypothetical protein
MSSNIKDTISTICGILLAICIPVEALQLAGSIVLPTSISPILVAIIAICTGVNGYLTGKAPAGTVKSPAEVIQGNSK